MELKVVAPFAAVLLAHTATGFAQPREELKGSAVASEAAILAADSAEAGSVALAPEQGADTSAPAEETRKSNRLVEEVIVTAQKREENLQDVPISIAAFSADKLDAMGVNDPKDMNLAVPSLHFSETGGFASVFLRGIGTDAFLFADPSVALYIDGIYFPFSHGLAQSFGAVERIEVLKGPQGTLFGRNATGGAINVITKAPSEQVETSVLMSYGSFDTLRTRAHANIPFGDSLAVSISGIYNNGEDFRDGTVAGHKHPRETSKGVRGKVRWTPVDSLELNLAAFTIRQQGLGALLMANVDPSPLGMAAGIQAQDHWEATGDADSGYYNRNTVFYGSAVWNAGPVDLKVIGSDQYAEDHALFDLDGSVRPLAQLDTLNGGSLFADVQTAEVQLLSNSESWMAERLKWIAGAYFFQSVQGFDPLRLKAAAINAASIEGLFGGNLPDSVATLLDTLPPEVTPAIGDHGILDTDSWAGFVQATYSITPLLDLTLGGRYQNEKRAISKAMTTLMIPDGPTIPLLVWNHLSDTTKSFSPKVSIDWRPFDEGMIYLSWQRATKSHAYNVVRIYSPPDVVRPEKIETYELGAKLTLLDGLMRLNMAAFRNDLKDLQTQFVSLQSSGVTSFENAEKAHSNGFEFDTTIEILPDLIEGLAMTASGMFLDAKFDRYTGATGYDDVTGLLVRNADYSGKRITRTPKFSSTLGLNKIFFIDSGSIEFGVNSYYNAGYYYLAQNSNDSKQPSFETVDLRASYFHEPWKLRISVYGRNITDSYYTNSALFLDFGRMDYPAAPANYGVQLSWDL